MEKFINIVVSVTLCILLIGCTDLDKNPLAEGSSENWYKTDEEIGISLNDLYRPSIWYVEGKRLYNTDRFTDDWNQRAYLYAYTSGSISSDWSDAEGTWKNTYKGISRANKILENLNKKENDLDISEEQRDVYKGEAYFFRASFYSYLIFLFGDVPYFESDLSIDEAFDIGRTDKGDILSNIYDDFDRAIKYLPKTNSNSDNVKRVNKGTAYAFKARTATWMLDYGTAKDAAKNCIDLDEYSLEDDYGHLFLPTTNESSEYIFVLPRSKELDETQGTTAWLPRYAGGTSTAQPSWELFCSFTCTDGLPIDESPLYDPQKPFKNRDPRISKTIIEFGTPHLGYIYDPGAKEVLNTSTNEMETNKETQFASQFASYNGLDLKKGVDESWTEENLMDGNNIIMRYADVLLMYAEAKMELNEIDGSLFDALNKVRARGYGLDFGSSEYPHITEADQSKLRTIIRTERRVELAWENRRYFDLIRWKIAEKALTTPVVGLPQKEGLEENIASGDYFFPKNALPEIDEDGLVDLTPLINTGKVRVITKRNFKNREYLWPIPTQEIEINDNLSQNPGY